MSYFPVLFLTNPNVILELKLLYTLVVVVSVMASHTFLQIMEFIARGVASSDHIICTVLSKPKKLIVSKQVVHSLQLCC